MKSHKILFAILLAVANSVAAAEEKKGDSGGDKGGIVKPGLTLRDLRSKDAAPEPSSVEAAPSSSEGVIVPEGWSSDPIRILGLTMATLACVTALLLLWRRRRFRIGASGGTRLEILDRIALSSRQWVCILRVDEKRVVVGVSGDSMTSLAVLDDATTGRPSGSSPRLSSPRRGGGSEGGQALEVEGRRLAEIGRAGQGSSVERSGTPRRESTRRDDGSFWFRPEKAPSRKDDPSGSGDDVSWESHLAPYRREVNRLRAMLQNWRQSTERGERAEHDRGEGKGE